MNMTIFSFPRPFIDSEKGKFKTIQENAITSWKLTHPDAEIILFGKESGTVEICKKLDLLYFPDVKINHFRTPFLNDLFERVQEIAESDVLCYLHSDIILIENMDFMIAEVKKQFPQFLLLARRRDLFSQWSGTVKESKELSMGKIDFQRNWKNFVEGMVNKYGRMRKGCSCDCYIFTKGLYPKGYLPAFLLGRQLWDGWIVYDILERNIPAVDISSFKIVHQTHTRHKWGLLPPTQWNEEGENNRRLTAGRKKRVDQTPYFWGDNKIQRRLQYG